MPPSWGAGARAAQGRRVVAQSRTQILQLIQQPVGHGKILGLACDVPTGQQSKDCRLVHLLASGSAAAPERRSADCTSRRQLIRRPSSSVPVMRSMASVAASASSNCTRPQPFESPVEVSETDTNATG
eukprot:scaffold26766_cov96-Isochrysis_galbana.AAC.3